MIDFKKPKLDFKIGSYIISFPSNIKFDTFNDPDNYYGINFYQDKYRFEIIASKIGTRLLITGKMGEAKDLPFNKGTLHFLPDFVQAQHIENKE